MPPGIEHLINYGVLGILVMFVLVAVWKLGSKGGAKVAELGERYVRSTESLHATLQESNIRQQSMCQSHNLAMEDLSESLERQVVVLDKSCSHLESLDRAHGSEWQKTMHIVHENSHDIQRGKKAALRFCEMCQLLCESEFPNSAVRVREHCDEIKRIIGEA
jgi:hypothetical protein